MTEIETEIETVTVTLEELKANLEHYYWLKKTKRLEVTYNGEMIAAVGPWLPDESRFMFMHWPALLNEMFPDPLEPGNSEPKLKAVEETRGPSFCISMLQPSPSWSETRKIRAALAIHR